MVRNARGMSNIGCLFILALIVCGLYVGYNFAAVQWNVETFKEQLADACRFFANDRAEVMVVKNDVIRRAQQCNFEIAAEDISVDSVGAYFTITVYWEEPIAFLGYVYNRPIEVTSRIRKFGY